jgi:hypothetical protein
VKHKRTKYKNNQIKIRKQIRTKKKKETEKQERKQA